MPDPTFIPGYLGTVLLNADDISAIGSVVSLSKTRNIMTKPTFGSPYAFSLGGQKLGSFSAQGHVSVEQIADIDNAFNSDAPIAFQPPDRRCRRHHRRRPLRRASVSSPTTPSKPTPTGSGTGVSKPRPAEQSPTPRPPREPGGAGTG